MSLSVVGVWAVGVWDTTVWADGVWREGTPAVDPDFILGSGSLYLSWNGNYYQNNL